MKNDKKRHFKKRPEREKITSVDDDTITHLAFVKKSLTPEDFKLTLKEACEMESIYNVAIVKSNFSIFLLEDFLEVRSTIIAFDKDGTMVAYKYYR